MPKGGSKPGQRRGGRKKGTPNKSTQDVVQRLEALGCDVIKGMALIAMGNVVCGVCHGKGKTQYQPARGKEKFIPRTCESCYGSGKERISPELRGKMYSDLAQYSFPKRKAIEITGSLEFSIAQILRERRAKRTS